MSIHQHKTLEDTVYFWFAANDTAGSGSDGASAAADVRLAGAASDAAPVLSPTPSLLSHASYPAGCYEVAVAATSANGFSAGATYGVFCTLAVDSQNPSGFVGSFALAPVIANVKEISDDSAAADNLELLIENGKGSDHKILLSTDAQDLSTSLDVRTKSFNASLGLTTQMKADVNAEADKALTDYDPPTNAELNARTLAAASYATDAKQDTIIGHVDTEIDAILTHLTDIKGTGFVKDTHSLPQCLTATSVNVADKTGFSLAADQSAVTIGTVNNATLANGAHGGAAASITLSDYANFKADVSGLSTLTVGDIISNISEGQYDLQEMLRLIFAACCLKSTGGGTGTINFRDATDSKNRITVSVDANGNRTPTTLDGD